MADNTETEARTAPAEPFDERAPTVVADGVDIIYRINGTGSGRGSATAALNRILRPKQAEKAAGMRIVHAVKKVSFVAYKGEAIGLIGTNGSGKSTLLKGIAGLQPVENGKIYTDGQPSLLGVNAALMGDLTGERNVYLGGLAMGMTREQIKERYQEIVDFSGINEKGDFISLPMRTYSSGMGSRLRFSIAAAKDHDVLLIDEALSTGDARFQARSAERIQEMRRHAGTVFLVSHSNAAIRDTCDRVLWLERGELRMDGLTEEVLQAYEAFTSGKKK
ncbi:ABC transporter ATP-binding protein [Streptomyces sp. NBC_01485]|uniref:ABC transporter ATP-binding protein n=1 Tax=Streptomyces sp. NBC_01485 TaxID=2903884 RepID=UPI002E331568|nr:ABC transporter ATP-binding protein [Streptomyces sp. NBC_01485]